MTPPETAAPAALPTRERSVITLLLVAAFVVILNETTLNVALTRIIADLGVDERQVQWLTTAFMLTTAVIIPITGWLIQRLRTRTLFVLAMSLFTAGTVVCAAAPAFGVLLAGRVVQAGGTAVMMPLLMTTVMQLVPPAGRGRVMGNISLVISVAPALGPTLSGILLQTGSWRATFLVVLPIAAATLVLGARRIADVGELSAGPLDTGSILLAAGGFGGLVYGLSLIGDPRVSPLQLPLVLTTGAVTLAGFLWRQVVLARTDRALLDLRAFRRPVFAVGMTMMAVATMALFGTIIMLPLILQQALHVSPVEVGLMMLPGGLAMGLLGPLVGRLYDRVGARPLIVPATLVVGAGFVGFSMIQPSSTWWAITLTHLAMTSAFAFVFTPLFTVSLGALPPRLYSHGSAIVGTAQQLFGAAGTALFVTLFATQSGLARSGGLGVEASLLTGSRWAFLAAGVLWLGAIAAAFWLRPAPVPAFVPETDAADTDAIVLAD